MKKPEGPSNVEFRLTADFRFWELVAVAAVCLAGALAGLVLIYWKS